MIPVFYFWLSNFQEIASCNLDKIWKPRIWIRVESNIGTKIAILHRRQILSTNNTEWTSSEKKNGWNIIQKYNAQIRTNIKGLKIDVKPNALPTFNTLNIFRFYNFRTYCILLASGPDLNHSSISSSYFSKNDEQANWSSFPKPKQVSSSTFTICYLPFLINTIFPSAND